MKRREWLWLATVLCACRTNAPSFDAFPQTVAGGWRRSSLRDVPVSDAPDPVPRNAITRLQEAVYEGPGRLDARAYALTSPEIGVELMQRWRPSADTVFFSRSSYFVVVKWQKAERKALQAFIHDVEARLPK